jgi:hypothetical protein
MRTLIVMLAFYSFLPIYGQDKDSLLIFETGVQIDASKIRNPNLDEYCIKTKDGNVFWLDGMYCNIEVDQRSTGDIEFSNHFYVSEFTQAIFYEYGRFVSNCPDSGGFILFHSCSFNLNGNLNWNKHDPIFELFPGKKNSIKDEIRVQSSLIHKQCRQSYDKVDIITLRVFYIKAFMLLISGVNDNYIKEIFRSNYIREASRHYLDEFNMLTSVLYELDIINSGDGLVLRPRCKGLL